MIKWTDLGPGRGAQLCRLYACVFQGASAWSAKALEALLADTSVLTLGAFEDAHIVAFGMAQRTDREAEILTLCVDPNRQGGGLGSELVLALKARCAQLGCQRLMLEVAADNHRALALYSRTGFRIDGRRKGYYRRSGGPAVDAVLMSSAIAGQIGTKRA